MGGGASIWRDGCIISQHLGLAGWLGRREKSQRECRLNATCYLIAGLDSPPPPFYSQATVIGLSCHRLQHITIASAIVQRVPTLDILYKRRYTCIAVHIYIYIYLHAIRNLNCFAITLQN